MNRKSRRHSFFLIEITGNKLSLSDKRKISTTSFIRDTTERQWDKINTPTNSKLI